MFLPIVFIFSTSICFGFYALLRKKYQEYNGTGLFPTFVFMLFYTIAEVGVTLLASFLFSQFANITSITPLTIILGVTFSLTSFITTCLCIIGAGYGNISILMMFATLGSLFISSTYDIITGQANITNSYIAALIFIGVILLIDILDNKKQSANNAKSSFVFKIICLVIFFTNGFGLVLYHLFAVYGNNFGNFNFIALYSASGFIISLIAILFLCLFRKKKYRISQIKKISGRSYIIIILYAVSLCVGEVLALNTTSIIPVSIHAPLSFAISLITVTLFDCVAYKTKIKSSQVIQMVAALLSAILISM